jgi:integrase
MAVSMQCRRMVDGRKYYTATVRVKPYPSASRTFSTRKDALEWGRANEKELKLQSERSGVRRDVTRITIGQLVAEYLSDHQTQQLVSYDARSRYLAWWSSHYGSERVMGFGVVQIREGRDAYSKGRGPAAVNRCLASLRAAWNWGRDAGLVPPERAWPERLAFTEPKDRVRFLSDAELTAVIAVAAQDSPAMHAAILVSIGCGIRKGELFRLKWTDIDLERQQLRIVKAKNVKADGESRSRSVYMPAIVVNAVRELRKAPIVGQYVICDENGQGVDRGWLFRRWDVIRAEAKLQDFHWHDLRHCCASFLAQNGASLLEIGHVLGHRNPATTMRYAHLVDAKPVTGHAGLEAKLRGSSK